MTQGSSPAACRMPTAPSSRVTSNMFADIIIGCTSSTGGPACGCPGRLSGGKYRRSLYIGVLSTVCDGDGELPVSSPPSRRTSRPFCAVAIRRSTGRVTAENFRSMPPLPRRPTCAARGPDSVHIMAHRRGCARCFGHGAGPFDQPSRPPRGRLPPRHTSRVGPVAHLLGAEADAPRIPDSGRLRIDDRRGQRRRSHRHRGTQRRRQVQFAGSAHRSGASRMPDGSPGAADCASGR